MDMSEDMVGRVARTARNLHRRFSMVPSDDIQQEIWAWILGHTDKIEEWEANDSLGKLGKAIYHAGLAYCQTEKASILGYKDDDNYYYSINPNSDYSIQAVLQQILSTIDSYDELHRTEVGDQAAVMDITNAFTDLPESDRHLLYGVLTSTEENACAAMGNEWGVTEDTVRSRYRRILKRMQRSLGGERPVYHTKVMSNAARQVLTRKEYLGE